MNNTMIGEAVISQREIEQGVAGIADRLNRQFDRAAIITVVPGGILFTADLVRKLTFEVSMDYISCPHTPGDRENASSIVFHNHLSIQNQHVIVVDDAIESGGTMKRLVAYLTTFAPQSLTVATLFVKPGRVDIAAEQYYAFEMENDDLLIGYGLPWENKYRNLPQIHQLKR